MNPLQSNELQTLTLILAILPSISTGLFGEFAGRISPEIELTPHQLRELSLGDLKLYLIISRNCFSLTKKNPKNAVLWQLRTRATCTILRSQFAQIEQELYTACKCEQLCVIYRCDLKYLLFTSGTRE